MPPFAPKRAHDKLWNVDSTCHLCPKQKHKRKRSHFFNLIIILHSMEQIYTCGAPPNRSSGVEVHNNTRSTSSGCTSAIVRAFFAASTARLVKLSFPAAA